jgi:ferrous iron transport protein B
MTAASEQLITNTESPLRIGLIGNPNSGKTTLFNGLTGLRAKVGNYPGVTVERREGNLDLPDRDAIVIDLPGTYSLDPISPDETVVSKVLRGEIPGVKSPQVLMLVADACTLERSLLLLGQVLALGLPTCLVLTMVDELRERGGKINLRRLSAALGIPVLPVVGHRGLGLERLRERLAKPENWTLPPVLPPDDPAERTAWAESILRSCVTQRPGRHPLTEKADAIILHPVWGTLLFLTVMMFFFQLIFAWATPAMDWIDTGVGQASDWVRTLVPPGLMADFLADGLIAGVGSVVVFLPQIIMLFSLIYFLEDVGYMARAAFVVDRAMERVGLEGRAFMSLLSSFACAVPGIMASRTLPSARDRLVTVLIAPLMTCSARLPVYALLIGAFIPSESSLGPLGVQGLVLFGLYIVAPLIAMIVAAVLRQTLLPGEGIPFTLELPSYRIPRLKHWLIQVWGSAQAFLRRAGTIILVASMILWALLTFPQTDPPADLGPEAAASFSLEHSAAGRIGKAIEPAIAPLGFDWKIGVGILASIAAREIFVSTLAQIYAVEDPDSSLRAAILADTDPESGEKIFSPPTVAALLVFFVLALQCTSTLAILARETNSLRWPAFAFTYMLVLAYVGAWATRHLVLALTS